MAKKYYEPVKLLVIIIVSIFVIESFIMHYLLNILPFSATAKGVIDSFVLTLLVFPSVYFFSFRPMELYVDEAQRERELAQKTTERLQHTMEGTIHALSQIAEFRDPYKQGIRSRVSQLAVAIGREMGLTENQIDGIRIAGLLFDIGKIAVPPEIANKPEIKDENELALYKEYPKVGYNLLKDIEFPSREGQGCVYQLRISKSLKFWY